MKKTLLLFFALMLALAACAVEPAPTTTMPPPPQTTVPETTVPETTVPETTAPPALADPLEDVLTWFDEVVLHMEYSDGTGNPALVKKWRFPILCRIEGDPTDEDLRVLEDFFDQLNALPGFPGIAMAEGLQRESLTLSFLGPEDFRDSFSEVVNGEDAWGAAQFWFYTDTNEIHTARIGYRTDIDQISRSSIVLEEIVNCLGLSDTELRQDSIVYQYSNDNICLSDVDWLILELLYRPDIQCGMDREQCHAVIESLYE